MEDSVVNRDEPRVGASSPITFFITSSYLRTVRITLARRDPPINEQRGAKSLITPCCKGKIARPNEFGKLVTIQESEHQIVTAYEVHTQRPADVTLWTRALDRHQAIFGRSPDIAAADRGFSSARNEQAATDRGVRQVILPRCGPKSPARRAYERQRWFRRGQRWRVGSEGRISVLKRRHGLDRCRYHGLDGVKRWVGLGVIANNLVSTATFSRARATA